MSKGFNLTDQRFGRLTVLKEGDRTKAGNRRWICQCDCGNEKTVMQSNLRSGHTRSCGCIGNSKQFEDLTGIKFGRWIILKRVENTELGQARWLCKCECGNEGVRFTQQLKSGISKSCGCLKRELENQPKKKNTYIEAHSYIIGKDENGNEFYFDKEDSELVIGLNAYWKVQTYTEGETYVATTKNKQFVKLHNLIMNTPEGYTVDHINGLPHDNRKENMRLCEFDKNTLNKKTYRNSPSGYSGVRPHKESGRWYAFIQINKKQVYLGSYETFENALKVRREAELKYYGEYSRDIEYKQIDEIVIQKLNDIHKYNDPLTKK